jgi:hypothetical protein
MSDQQYRLAQSRWDVTAVIFAVTVTMFELMVLFAKPTISLFGKTEVVTQGIAAFGLLTGAMFWAMIELITPAGKGGTFHTDLLMRFFGSFIAGFFIGGFLADYFAWGQYLIVPMYAHNWLALYNVLGILFVFMVLVSDAAWAHNKTFIRKGRANHGRMAGLVMLPASYVSASTSTTSSSGINVSQIFQGIWNLFLGLVSSIISDFETLISSGTGGLSNATMTMFQYWSVSLSSMGIWGPVTFVIILGVAAFMLYFFLDAVGVERDFLRGEEDI